MLLALGIPCSAQLTVILAMLGSLSLAAMFVWIAVVFGVIVLVGSLAARVVPGERPSFYMEIPPLRLPNPRNVFVKTFTRVKWYFREVMPLFVLASFLIWVGKITHVCDLVVAALRWLSCL